MMINTMIIPGKSLGGIKLGSNVEDLIYALSDIYFLDSGPDSIIINGGMITAYHNDRGQVVALSCDSSFKGNFQAKLWPGMTVSDVQRTTKKQIAEEGFVKVDKISGVGLPLPKDRDDFERLTDHFSDDYVFEELWVYRH